MDNFNVYKDIQARTKGEIYIGVVGPVRTGKSTFIKRFMELAVLPAMEDESLKAVSTDELPQSAGGKRDDNGTEIYPQRGGADHFGRRDPGESAPHRLCRLYGRRGCRPCGKWGRADGENALV